MAYFDQTRKAQMAPAVKVLCKKYGVKASLAVRNRSTVVLNIKSADIDFITNFNETVTNDFYLSSQMAYGGAFTPAKDNISVNPYHFEKHFSGQALAFLTEMFDVLGDGNHDNSDIQTDYFDVGWYTDVNIGSWNKPFTVSL